MSARHTPGPWFLEPDTEPMNEHNPFDDGERGWFIMYQNGDQKGVVTYVPEGRQAHLIAAAPELLDILEQLMPGISLEVECRKHGGNDEDWLELERLEQHAYTVIANAKGSAA